MFLCVFCFKIVFFYSDNTLNCSACGIYWFIQSMQLYHPRFSMHTLAPRWYSDRMTHGHFLPVYSRIPGPVTLYTQSIQSYQDTAEHIEYHHFYRPNQKVFLSPIWYHQSNVLPLPNVAPKQAPGFSHHEMPSEAWPEGFRGELRWGKLQRVLGVNWELPEFVKEDLRRVYGTYPSR